MAKILALITARGRSKAIPRKNVVLLGGKPLIAWTIEAARQSRGVDRIIVSTDDTEIAQVARECGADVPFLRPAALAQDDSAHMPVVIHALEWLETEDKAKYDYVLLLQPTSPLRSSEDIERAIEIASTQDADSVVSVSEAASHPYLTKRITDEGLLEDFIPKPEGYLARQSLPPAYALNGAIYLVRREVLLRQRSFYAERTYAYVMPPERSLDIDTPWDLHLVNLILNDRLRIKE